jgi:uncharacterized protein (DUF736 family)
VGDRSALGLADAKLTPIFGARTKVSMFEMSKLLAAHLKWAPRRGQAPAPGQPAAGRGLFLARRVRTRSARNGFAVLRWRCGPAAARLAFRPTPGSPSRPRLARPDQIRRRTMTTLGTFARSADGSFSGSIRTLTFAAKAVEFRPVLRTSPKAPDLRVYASGVEIGAAWSPAADSEQRHVNVRLDDPSFAAPLYARLVEADGVHQLIWTRLAKAS